MSKDYELAEDSSPLQELTEKIKEFIAEEAAGEPYAFVLDALMNSMIHIASDARPDVTIPTILDFPDGRSEALSGGGPRDGGLGRYVARPSLGSIYAHRAKAVVAISRGMT